MTEPEIEMMWLYVGEVWPSFRIPAEPELRALRMRAWLDQLGDIDGQLVRATFVALGYHEFVPPLGIVRQRALELAAASRGESPIPDVDQAWSEVVAAFHGCGSYGTPSWSHPAVAAAVQAMGWREMCLSEQPDVVRGQFVRLYGVVSARHVRESVTPPPAVAALLAGAQRALKRVDQ